MIYLEQTVNQILNEEGQTVLSLSDLGITWEELEKLFIGTYEQAKGYISIYDWQQQVIGNSPQKNEDWTHIRHITYNAYNNMQRFMPDVPGNYWEFNPYTKNTMSLMNANFSLEVGKYPTCSQLDYSTFFDDVKQDNKIGFSLPFTFDYKNFKILDTENNKYLDVKAEEITEEGTAETGCCADGNTKTTIKITGDANGSFDPKTFVGDLTLNDNYKSLELSTLSKYVGIKELDLTCELFYMWFKGNLLCMIGSVKKQIDLPGVGLPFDFNQDDILARGREIMNKVDELKNSKSHWSNF